MGWKYDWSTRTDMYGNPAGILSTTPFPVNENTSSWSIANDEGTKTFSVGTFVHVNGGYDGSNGASDGSFTKPYTTIGDGRDNSSAGNYTILVRGANSDYNVFDGVYEETLSLANYYGSSDTARWSIVGYGQERPVIDGSDGIGSIITRGDADDSPAYITLQRLKLQNTNASGVRLGWDSDGDKRDEYFNCIDIHFSYCGGSTSDAGAHDGGDNQSALTDSSKSWSTDEFVGFTVRNATKDETGTVTANTSDTITATLSGGADWDDGDEYSVFYPTSGSCYYLNTDNGWIYHCLSEYTIGHGFKMGDGSSSGIIEWCLARYIGYWGGGDTVYKHSAVGIDFPCDTVVRNQHDVTCRYNIAHSVVNYGFQLRRIDGFEFHHNEFYDCVHHDEIPPLGGTLGKFMGIIFAGQTNGNFYSNIIRTPGNAGAIPLLISGLDTNSPIVNVYNNLIYGGSDVDTNVIDVGTANSGATIRLYHNLFYGDVDTGVTDGIVLNRYGASLILQGNILVNAGPGDCVNDYLVSECTHRGNIYYAPSGDVGVTLGVDEIEHDPGLTLPSGSYSFGDGEGNLIPGIVDPSIFYEDFHGNKRLIWNMGPFDGLADDRFLGAVPAGMRVL